MKSIHVQSLHASSARLLIAVGVQFKIQVLQGLRLVDWRIVTYVLVELVAYIFRV